MLCENINDKEFNYVFRLLSLPTDTREVFSGATVTKHVIHRRERYFELGLSLPQIISEFYIDKMKNEMLEQLPLNDMHIEFIYPHTETDLKKIIESSWENIVYSVSKESPLCKNIIQRAEWVLNGSKMEIHVKNGTSYYLLRRGIDKFIEDKLINQHNVNVKILFKDKLSTAEETAIFRKEIEEKEMSILKELQEQKNEAVKEAEDNAAAAASEKIASGIVIGKEISESVSKISETKNEGEKVVVEGRIFNVDAREIKGGRYIVSFDITDFTDSTTVKFFVDKKIFDSEMQSIFKRDSYLKVKGEVQFDKYAKEINILSRDISLGKAPEKRKDTAPVKRVELHLHTQMSRMDGITAAKEYIKRALEWGHDAIAITDHGVVQAFPEAMETSGDKKLIDKYNKKLKVIYGVEGYLIDDLGTAVTCPRGQSLDAEFTVFDIETTGLSSYKDKITEIGAVKVVNGKIAEKFSTFVNPQVHISDEITKLTGIDDSMVADAPTIEEVLPKFIKFFGDSVLVAHNAMFDTSFIRKAAERAGLPAIENTVLDTLELAKSLLPNLGKHKLDIVANHLSIELNGHHRAVNDAQCTAEILEKFIEMLAEKEIYNVDDINVFCSRTVNYSKLRSNHIIILVKNYVGLRNLYELISMSHIEYFAKKRPRIPKSKLMAHREGLILGSACEAGELYRALLDGKPEEVINGIVNFYDYLEIQPLGNNKFMINSQKVDAVNSIDDIMALNRKIVDLGEKHDKPVVATCDVHFIDPHDSDFRKIILTAEGFVDADNQAPLYFRTTDEMLDEFLYLGDKKAYEVVVENTNLIADMIDDIKPIPDGTFPPHFEGCEEDLRRITMTKATSMYGDPLPEIVEKRLNRELNSIINNGYSVLYIIAQRLVWNSNDNGYLVGSRGSVGSSFVATMAGITEVNPLQPHYLCPNCKYSDFESETVKKVFMEGGSGCDMPDAYCPNCGALLNKEGHDIPFETFLGFEGDKEPDIDLNFSGEYQQQAHAYTEELFGKGKVFKAGTIGTLADKTAYGFALKYFEKKEITAHNAEIRRLADGCTGIKRTTGQHPGGLMVVPEDHDIHEFCPIQRPADDVTSNITTTHFDYHSISGRLLKLDLLGHDDPTVIRMLHDLTGINPQTVKLDDAETMSLFESPKALGVTAEEINCETGTLGIPEFGTKFVRQMLIDTKPKTFSDLLRISGLSHGTDVWVNNAADLIADGTITLKDTISTRDSIMSYLITKGVPNKTSFKIMEKVRKGKGLDEDDMSVMKEHNVPQWYIDSCLKIKYMFPKAHAAAYVMMAFRIAYFKVNHPLAYYASYFTVRACDDFDYSCMCLGEEVARQSAKNIYQLGNSATTKEKNKLTVLELVIEFYARGFKFYPIDLYKSDSKKFVIFENGLIPPFNSLQGLGENAAQGIVDGRNSVDEFKTIEEFKEKTAIGKTLIELLKENGVLKGIPETNQLTLF